MSKSGEDFLDDTAADKDESEDEILRLRALIETVRPYPALYAKTKKEYCGKTFSPDSAWQTVGSTQVPPLFGEVDKDQFYKLRQKFGKEWRKFQAHQKGKSGQGANAPFISTWVLYDDMKFLGDHITPRKCVNFVVAYRDLKSGNITESVLDHSEQSEEAGTSDSDTVKNQHTPTDLVLKAMADAARTKKLVPASDQFAAKREKSDKEFMDSMIAQGNALTKVAAAFRKALDKETTVPPHPPAPPAVESPILGAIKFALEYVPEEKKLMYLTELLSIISTKYAKKD